MAGKRAGCTRCRTALRSIHLDMKLLGAQPSEPTNAASMNQPSKSRFGTAGTARLQTMLKHIGTSKLYQDFLDPRTPVLLKAGSRTLTPRSSFVSPQTSLQTSLQTSPQQSLPSRAASPRRSESPRRPESPTSVRSPSPRPVAPKILPSPLVCGSPLISSSPIPASPRHQPSLKSLDSPLTAAQSAMTLYTAPSTPTYLPSPVESPLRYPESVCRTGPANTLLKHEISEESLLALKHESNGSEESLSAGSVIIEKAKHVSITINPIKEVVYCKGEVVREGALSSCNCS